MISILGNKVARGFTRRPDFEPDHFTRLDFVCLPCRQGPSGCRSQDRTEALTLFWRRPAKVLTSPIALHKRYGELHEPPQGKTGSSQNAVQAERTVGRSEE